MKRTKIVLALLLLAVMLTSSFALVACDKTPEKYKMKTFTALTISTQTIITPYFSLLMENGEPTNYLQGGGKFAS